MQKILILRFSSIGDIVLTTPVVRCLKKQLPSSEIHYLTKPAFATILENNPYIDKIHVLDKPLLDKIKDLKAIGFDCILDLHHNIRTLLIKSLLDIPTFSFNKLNVEKWLLVNTGIDILPSVHIVDRYFETAKNLDIKNDNQGLDFFIADSIELPKNLPATYIAFAIGAQHATKRLPTNKIIDLCNQLHLPVILLGGKEDIEPGNQIANSSTNQIINLCGQTNLQQSALVIKHSFKVIAHDTGLMHIAAALGKDVLSVWGNTIPQFGMYPYTKNNKSNYSLFEVTNLSCRPCSKIGFNSCPKQHFNCMNQQDLAKIAEKAKDWVY